MKTLRIFVLVLALAAFVSGCSQDDSVTAPDQTGDIATGADKDGTETLGAPSIPIADGSGIAEGGAGMAGVASNTLDIEVPLGATINQVLVYWAGATTDGTGDDNISLDGNAITGQLIGGETPFYNHEGNWYVFRAYRADITALGLVSPGANTLTVSDFDFDDNVGVVDENNGVSVLAIYDDGSTASVTIRDGLDMAFFNFSNPLDATVPQVFTFDAEPVARQAELVILAGSVGDGRPNAIRATPTSGVDQIFDNALGSLDGFQWDSIVLLVDIPAGDTSVEVEVISTASDNPLGASLGWVGAGLTVPETHVPPASIGDRVWIDENMNGLQDPGEPGYPGAAVQLIDCDGNVLDNTVTDGDGYYLFDGLMPGDYRLRFIKPEGYEFTELWAGAPDPATGPINSDADPLTGETPICTTLDPGEIDLDWDAGVYRLEQPGCSLTIGFWKNHAGFGPQDDVVSDLLPIWLGDVGVDNKSLYVDSAELAVSILQMKDFGGGRNGIAKLYAQLLATKLNIANGASGADVAAAIAEADAFLAVYDSGDWFNFNRQEMKEITGLMSFFDDYNNGEIGPGHCD